MKLTRIIGSLLLGGLLVAACTKQETQYYWSEDAPHVVAIDSLLQQQPDSALAYLEWFDSIDYKSIETPYNHYLNLMLSEAAFKVRKEVVLADEIGAAVVCFDSMAEAYPQADNLAFLSARAHYMNAVCINNGIIFTDDSLTMMACQEYYKALEIMEQHFDVAQIAGHKASFMALVFARLANIYSDKFLINPTTFFYKEVLNCKEKANASPSSLSNTLFFLGYEYEKAEEYEYALHYYNQSLDHIADTTGVLYRNVVNRKALSSYHVDHDTAASIAAIKRIAAAGMDFERYDRYLGIGYLYTLERQYDSALVYLNEVFEESPSLFLCTQSAEHLSEIYDQLGDAQKASEYARFVTQNTPPEFGTKADEWRYNNLFDEYLSQRHDRASAHAQRSDRIWMMKEVVAVVLVFAALLLWLLVYRRRHKRSEAEKDALSGQLKEQEEALSVMKQRVEAASFAEEPVCRLIMERVNEGQFKSKVDYLVYKDYALTKEQLLALREAADVHFGQFTARLKQEYPALTKGDLDYCCLYLLGVEEADVAALMQRAFNTVCERSRKLKGIFGSDEPLSTTLRDFAKSNASR